MRLVTVLKTASPAATRLAGAAFAALTFKILVLNRWGVLVPSIYDLGLVFEAVLASVVASYVFYLVVVHLKETNDQLIVAPYIDRHSLRVVGDCESQLNEIAKTSKVALSLATITSDTLLQAFSSIPPYSSAPLILTPNNTYANWFQYFEYHKNRSKESIARVLAQLIYLDSQHVSLLAEIDDCTHFSVISQVLHSKMSNPDLSAFSSTFFSYCQKCLELKKYMEAKAARHAP